MRKINKQRKTKETQIQVSLNIDGSGEADIKTGINFLDHMLTLFAFHGLFDLNIQAKGDLGIDIHHTNEDIGIVLGQAFKEALADKSGIKRFGFASVPMEDVLASVTLVIGGRGYFSGVRTNFGIMAAATSESYSIEYANHFFESFAKHSGINLIIKIETAVSTAGSIDIHTGLEPVFKAWALALDQATSIDSRRRGVPSTKGIID